MNADSKNKKNTHFYMHTYPHTSYTYTSYTYR